MRPTLTATYQVDDDFHGTRSYTSYYAEAICRILGEKLDFQARELIRARGITMKGIRLLQTFIRAFLEWRG